ncbi:electron transfer flavoprotein subunit beta [Azospirillum sp. TSO35-2]|uniref:electron transfer flavoprotein subunit beta n=1 Tax=Azospirillum sp. TSO35-2 TaxID=716796 RepID=UPI000D60499A|nr:electron transfer flavoprotein subunit beta [Azospirillum sp. TSO35-2]PWC31308.1 electron transfer flavoprotein subunit beta [Azospirillum sp. TSO35-2]
MVDVAILLSVGRHPVSGRARRAPTDARALEMALGLPAVRRTALHAGDPASPALRDYLGMGLDRLTVLAMAHGCDPVEPLAAHLRSLSPGIVLTGNRAEGGEDSGMLPYRVAHTLGVAIVPDVVAITVEAGGGAAEVVQALARGQRRALRVALPFVATIHPAAPSARPSAFGPARRGRIDSVPVEAPPDAFLAACAARPWRDRPKRLTVGAPGSGGALDRLRAATEAKAGQGRLLVGPSPDEAALAIYECLQEQGVLPR